MFVGEFCIISSLLLRRAWQDAQQPPRHACVRLLHPYPFCIACRFAACPQVIAYMTVGIDVSRLFSDMILACNTRDLVVKKMVYLYLCAYAQSNPDLTLLAINTLQKDW